ncbi:hypothetical protein KM043_007291 [Ampulex compressa]|nr:hypothetical protein KM043_007291 [Ampulex compressa]
MARDLEEEKREDENGAGKVSARSRKRPGGARTDRSEGGRGENPTRTNRSNRIAPLATFFLERNEERVARAPFHSSVPSVPSAAHASSSALPDSAPMHAPRTGHGILLDPRQRSREVSERTKHGDLADSSGGVFPWPRAAKSGQEREGAGRSGEERVDGRGRGESRSRKAEPQAERDFLEMPPKQGGGQGHALGGVRKARTGVVPTASRVLLAIDLWISRHIVPPLVRNSAAEGDKGWSSVGTEGRVCEEPICLSSNIGFWR